MPHAFILGVCAAVVGIILLVVVVVSIYLVLAVKKDRDDIKNIYTQINMNIGHLTGEVDKKVLEINNDISKMNDELQRYVEEKERNSKTYTDSTISSRMDKHIQSSHSHVAVPM